MRQSKVITIEGRGEVIVKEVSPLAVYEAWGAENRLEELKRLLEDALDPGVETIKSWYASELEQVLTAFLEVNASFFGIARALKMDGLLGGILTQIGNSLPAAFAASFRRAIGTPGITAGDFS